MDSPYLYHQIADKIHRDILTGVLSPGDRLKTIRQMAAEHGCTIGTIQRAYQELANAGLVTRRSGQGTRVVDRLPPSLQADAPLRQAALVHRCEAFLLEALSTGHSVPEIESAIRQALDRWRVVEKSKPPSLAGTLRFVGSHDPAIVWLASRFPELAPGYMLDLEFTGSMGGLAALVESRADLAGIHLWDEESGVYNVPFVHRFFPRQLMLLVTLAHRRLGLILPPGNPGRIHGLGDLARPEIKIASRQPGSGTRVWLDASLARLGFSLDASHMLELLTHYEVAQAVAENRAEIGIGAQTAALSFGLDFCELTLERYDLVFSGKMAETRPIQMILQVLQNTAVRQNIQEMGGYDTTETGLFTWVK